MYTLDSKLPVSPKDDIEPMARFVASRWTSGPDYLGLLGKIEALAAHDSLFMFDPYEVQNALRTRLQERRESLSRIVPHAYAYLYDRAAVLLNQLITHVERVDKAVLREASRTGTEYQAEAQIAQIHECVRGRDAVGDAKPLGWAALAENYADCDGMTEYAEEQQERDETEFQGGDTACAVGPGFQHRVSLPYTMYDERSQRGSASLTLVGAAYGQFLALHRHCNTRRIVRAIEDVKLPDPNDGVVFEWNFVCSEPSLQTLVAVTRIGEAPPTAADYAKAVEGAAAFAAKSPEEKAEIWKASRLDLEALFQASGVDEQRLAADRHKEAAAIQYLRDLRTGRRGERR